MPFRKCLANLDRDEELKIWTVADERKQAWLSSDLKTGFSFGGGLDGVLEANMAPSSTKTVIVTGEEGLRRELKE